MNHLLLWAIWISCHRGRFTPWLRRLVHIHEDPTMNPTQGPTSYTLRLFMVSLPHSSYIEGEHLKIGHYLFLTFIHLFIPLHSMDTNKAKETFFLLKQSKTRISTSRIRNGSNYFYLNSKNITIRWVTHKNYTISHNRMNIKQIKHP